MCRAAARIQGSTHPVLGMQAVLNRCSHGHVTWRGGYFSTMIVSLSSFCKDHRDDAFTPEALLLSPNSN